MKKIFICIISILYTTLVFSQEREKTLLDFLKDENYCNPESKKKLIKHYYSPYQYISNYSMNILIRQDLTKITLDLDGEPTIGNYASLKYSEDKSKITLNTSIFNPFKKNKETDPIKSILSFNLKATATDGAVSIISNKNASSGTGLTTKFTFISRKTNYQNDSLFNCNRIKLYREYLKKEYLSQSNLHQLNLKIKREEFKTKEVKINKELDSLLKTNDAVALHIKQKEEILLIQDKQDFEINKTPYKNSAFIDSIYKKLLKIETTDVKWDSYKLKWFDIDLSISGEKYNTFNQSQIIANQIKKEDFTSWGIGFTWNNFYSAGNGFLKNGAFLKFGYLIGNGNNLQGEETKEATSSILIDSAGFKRAVTEKKNVFEGVLNKTYSHQLSLQFSRYNNEKKSSSLNGYTKLDFEFEDFKHGLELKKPKWKVGTGYNFSLLDKDKLKSYLNLELFMNFNDILNSAKKETKFYQRYEVGLKIGVPFNSIFLNKTS